jgi:hypothetical protein
MYGACLARIEWSLLGDVSTNMIQKLAVGVNYQSGSQGRGY